MDKYWEKRRCECGRGYSVEQIPGDELEEPGCPECGETNSELISDPAAEVPDWEAAARELLELLEGIEPHSYSLKTKAYKLVHGEKLLEPPAPKHWVDTYPHEVHASVILKNNKIEIWKVGERKLSSGYQIDDLQTRHPEYSYHEKTWVVNNRDEHHAVFDRYARDWYKQWQHADDFGGFHAYKVEE